MPQPTVTATMAPDEVKEARLRIARHLAELHKLHLSLAQATRELKRFSLGGNARIEAEIAAETLEQYLSATSAFLENMRGRFEARLPTIRRGEPQGSSAATDAVGHGAFWLAFSRLCAVLRQIERRVAG